MNPVLLLLAVLLFVSAFLVLYRITKGPTYLDRMLGVDMMTSILIGAFALLAAATRRADLLPVFVVLGLVGFVRSTALARFATLADPDERRVLTRAEAEAADRALMDLSEEAAPVHDVDSEED